MRLWIFASLLAMAAIGAAAAVAEDFTYNGICDASGAVVVGTHHILVANDETDVLNLYSLGSSDAVKTFDLTDALQEEGREADLEAATQVQNTRLTYWISSHGRNNEGKLRPDRYRLFGLLLEGDSSELEIRMLGGEPYRDLLPDLLDEASWEEPDAEILSSLKKATRLNRQKVEELAPKVAGLNIEGLAAGRSGNTLLIGFRNPLIEGKAMVVELLNPGEVVAGQHRARFGRAILLDLGGLGIRSMEYSPQHGVYFLVAGPVGSTGSSYLVTWSGEVRHKPVSWGVLDAGEGRNPEALVVHPVRGSVQILFDEGSRTVNGDECKELPTSRQAFSGRELALGIRSGGG